MVNLLRNGREAAGWSKADAQRLRTRQHWASGCSKPAEEWSVQKGFATRPARVRDESDMSLRRTQPRCVLVAAAALSLFFVSCVPWQWEYLITATDRATQDEVRQKMGAPNLTKSLDGIESIWTYRYEVSSSFLFRRGDMIGGSPCIEYVLDFDATHVLRYWVRQPC